MATDVENSNIYAIIIILLAETVGLWIIYIFILFGSNWKTIKALEFSFIWTMVILETLEVIFRLRSSFNEDKDFVALKILLSLNRVLRVYMVYGRLAALSGIFTQEILKHSHKLGAVVNKQGKVVLYFFTT